MYKKNALPKNSCNLNYLKKKTNKHKIYIKEILLYKFCITRLCVDRRMFLSMDKKKVPLSSHFIATSITIKGNPNLYHCIPPPKMTFEL